MNNDLATATVNNSFDAFIFWVNRPQNEFIWVRSYKDKADLEAKNQEFQAAVRTAGIKLGGKAAKTEVCEVESAFAEKGARRRSQTATDPRLECLAATAGV